jgi:hypothetical protein
MWCKYLSFDGPYKKGHIAIHHLNLTKAVKRLRSECEPKKEEKS